MEPEKITLSQTQIDNLLEGDGVLEVEIENGVVTFNV